MAQVKALQDQMSEMKADYSFLAHQLQMIMKVLHVPACGCADCRQNLGEARQVVSGSDASSSVAHATKAEIVETDESKQDDLAPLLTPTLPPELQAVTPTALTPPESIDDLVATMPSSPPPRAGGRKSKYCSPAEKKAVAAFARLHGAAAAARHFNIPPAVAAYYQRKESQKKQQQQLAQVSSMIAQTAQVTGAEPQTPGLNPLTMPLGIGDRHPGMFLRGRGRGRPKLIGDELDADLVEYIVNLKKADARFAHLSASQALNVARDYIMKHSPHILEENGGQVRLKLTWAMKLVSRVAEREREVHLGLPAGTLQSLCRSLPAPGGLMADAMAQSFISQQISDLVTQMTNAQQQATGSVELENVKELDLSLLASFGSSSGEMETDGDGEPSGDTSPDFESKDGEDAGEQSGRQFVFLTA